MRTIRRLYFYTVSLVSLEVVLWGLIGLARSAITPDLIGDGSSRLAKALALILVGVPVFLIHWQVAQRNSREEMEEHASGVRSFFLYATLLGTLLPITQNLLSLVNSLVLKIFGMSPYLVMFNPDQTWSDNLVAILMNGLVAVYFLRILHRDWATVTPLESLSNQRRLYRTIWVVYGLALVVAGVQQMLRFILSVPSIEMFGSSVRATFINGFSLLLVGTPVFVYSWLIAQNALKDDKERESLLRLGLLYVLALSGVITVLTSSGIVADALLRVALGEKMEIAKFMELISNPLAIGVPLAGVWAYFSRWLNRSLGEVPDAPRRAGLRRLYFYILSTIGLAATFIGLSLLLLFIIDSLLVFATRDSGLPSQLAASLAVLLVSLPLWMFTWRPMQAEALQSGDSGDHARRSLMRRIYLYLVLFASVIGGMITTGAALYLVLRSLLGNQTTGMLREVLNNLQLLLLFIMMGLYHAVTLKKDGQRAAEALNQKHAAFPVIILDPFDQDFIDKLTQLITKQVPQLPVEVHPASQPLSSEQLSTFKAILLPGETILQPSPALAESLSAFKGAKIILPRPVAGWIWSGTGGRSTQEIQRQAIQILRQLAEGQEVRPASASSGWMVAFYILLGTILLPVVISLIGSIVFR